ncbi:MAG TPA: branched-chain amino acid ABC transporter permease [Clostridiaceae bacterium]|nr:branched-chain amino acid ABC transporter permease [Clostridiaceae bacterium]
MKLTSLWSTFRASRNFKWVVLAAIVISGSLLLLLPFITSNTYVLHIMISIGLYSVLALSLNLVTGFAGQLSFCHIAFYGIGAYTGALLMLRLNVSFWIAMFAGAFMAAIFGFLLGLPTLRLRGDYLAIVTLGFGEIVRLVFVNESWLTRGPLGLPGVPAPVLFGYRFSGRVPYYYLILVVFLITWFIMRRLTVSGIGLAMLSVKSDEIAAESVGIRPVKYKLMAFVISAAIAGWVGTFYASYIAFVSPDTFMYTDSITVLAMVILGGLGSLPGAVVGATVLTLIPELLRAINEYRMVLYGLLMIVMMIFRPDGFWGMRYRVKNAYKKTIRRVKDD